MHDENCLFCKIATGEIPSTKVYEDDTVLAFEDVNPQMPVHVLVIPKQHYGNFGDDVPADTLSSIMAAVKKVAEATGIAESGFRVLSNAGPDAQQVVPHLHVHVLGGAEMNSGDPSK